jgi:transcriptional regulator with XRE-family HTH domain
MMSVGTRIHDQREARKMSQSELAKRVGLTSAAIWNWETKGRGPRPQALAKVAKALNVSAEYLAEGREDADLSRSKTAKALPLAPEEARDQTTVSELMEQTRLQIAELTGFDPSQIKLTLTTIT